jgi:hypothetical protein
VTSALTVVQVPPLVHFFQAILGWVSVVCVPTCWAAVMPAMAASTRANILKRYFKKVKNYFLSGDGSKIDSSNYIAGGFMDLIVIPIEDQVAMNLPALIYRCPSPSSSGHIAVRYDIDFVVYGSKIF